MKTIIFLAVLWFSTFVVAAQTLTTLVQFDGTNGSTPFTIIQGKDNNFYGTTGNSIFKMTPRGSFTTLTNLRFTSGDTGVYPMNSLIQGNDGSFYGTRSYIDSGNHAGMIFKMTSEGAMTILANFETNLNDEIIRFGAPAGLTQGSDGNFYGTMHWGIDSPFAGSIFKITPEGALTTLVNLNGTNGFSPNSPPIQANDGNFYGTTDSGGDSSLESGAGGGTIYKMMPNGNLATLVIFEGTNGDDPLGGLVQASDGNLYGTCAYGGLYDKGTVFRLTTNGALTTLFNFNGANGARPATTLIQASDGNFYGTTTEGGQLGGGTIFKMTLDGTLTTLVAFHGSDGWEPYGSLIQATDGNLYGVTSEGGNLSINYPYGDGTIFKISGLNLLPSFQSITLTNGNVNLTWNSVSNWTYRVQYKTSLTATNWTDLPVDILATNTTSSKTDAAVPTGRFYRLVLLR